MSESKQGAKQDAPRRLTSAELASMPAWDAARALGCSYEGDCNPIDHDGFFFSLHDWLENGFCNVVEFWVDPDANQLVVSCGSIHRPDDEQELARALSGAGIPPDEIDPNNPAIEIVACRYMNGIEPDAYAQPMRFRYGTNEARIWGRVRGWIEELAARD